MLDGVADERSTFGIALTCASVDFAHSVFVRLFGKPQLQFHWAILTAPATQVCRDATLTLPDVHPTDHRPRAADRERWHAPLAARPARRPLSPGVVGQVCRSRGVDRHVSMAVVRVTTSGRVIPPPKSSRMKVSMSSSRPRRSDSSIICVPE